jgi:uncharacterized membrane protein
MSAAATVWLQIKKYFISGVLVVVPFILSFLILRFLFETVDGILGPLLNNLLGYYRSGLGLLTTLLIILLAGVLTRNLIGAQLYHLSDRLLAKVPLIRPIYSSSKQLLEALAKTDATSFQGVALIEYPRQGLFSLCLVSRRSHMVINGVDREYCACFVPSTPTPVSGMTVVVPSEDVIPVEMTIEEGVKFFVSGGAVSPDVIKNRARLPQAPKREDGV